MGWDNGGCARQLVTMPTVHTMGQCRAAVPRLHHRDARQSDRHAARPSTKPDHEPENACRNHGNDSSRTAPRHPIPQSPNPPEVGVLREVFFGTRTPSREGVLQGVLLCRSGGIERLSGPCRRVTPELRPRSGASVSVHGTSPARFPAPRGGPRACDTDGPR